MKLLIIITQKEDGENLVEALVEKKHRVTFFQGKGGFLKRDSLVILTGTKKEKIKEIFTLIKNHCKRRKEFIPSTLESVPEGQAVEMPPVPIVVGGAVVFVVPAEEFKEF